MTETAVATEPERVTIVEVGPRDGLQNEPGVIATAVKVAFIEALLDAGLTRIEACGFVSPKWVPQLGDAADVVAGLSVRPSAIISALVPNEQGYDRALAAGLREVAVFTAASETFNRKNTNASIASSFQRFAPIFTRAAADGVRVRGYVSCAFGCPYEGPVDPRVVVAIGKRLLDAGCFEVSLGDTIGVATPGGVHAVLDVWEARRLPLACLALHMHDTRGTALVNVAAGLGRGVRTFDASAGGLGGCPYAPGATGNLATEDLVYFLEGERFFAGVDLGRLARASARIEAALAHELPSRTYRALRSLNPPPGP